MDHSIRPGKPMLDTDGKRIQAHGAGIFYENGTYTHFTHEGRHYLLTSGMTGYVPNPSEVAVSDDPLGPYVLIGNPHRNDESCASFNSQVSFIFQDPQWDNFYLVMADRWVPKYVVTRKRYQQILCVVAHQSDKTYKPSLSDYLTVAGAPFLGTANTSIADYVWLPMCFEGETPVIDWHDRWIIEEQARKGWTLIRRRTFYMPALYQ